MLARLDHPLARLLAGLQPHVGGALTADHRGALGCAGLPAPGPGPGCACAAPRCPRRPSGASALILRSSLWRASSSSSQTLSRQASKCSKPRSWRRTLAAVDPERRARQVRAARRGRGRSGRRPRASAQPVLQPANRRDVEMVGRLVEQHEVRRLGQQAGQRGAAPFAARGRGTGRARGRRRAPPPPRRRAIPRRGQGRRGREIAQRGVARTGPGPAPCSRRWPRAARSARRNRVRPDRP